MQNQLPRDKKGRFLKGYKYNQETQFKKGDIPKNAIKEGEHLSKNTEFKKGQVSHIKGKTFEEVYGKEKADELKQIIINTHKGKKLSRERIEVIRTRIVNQWKDEDYKKRVSKNISSSLIGKKKGPQSKEHIEKKIQILKEWYSNPKNKEIIAKRNKKISERVKGKKRSPESIERIRRSHLGRKLSEEHKRKISLSGLGRKLPPKTQEQRRVLSQKQTALWKNQDYKKRQLILQAQGLKVKPTRPERVIINLCLINNFKFVYVGDGRRWFNGQKYSFNPDFIDEDNKLIIEFYGDYWHNLENKKDRDIERLKTYESEGYKTLIIWEKEMKDIDKVKNKIDQFIQLK